MFNILSIDSQGFFNGTMVLYPFDKSPSNVTGKYDKTLNEIVFGNVTEYPQFSENESYSGYRFTNIVANCIAGIGPATAHSIQHLLEHLTEVIIKHLVGTQFINQKSVRPVQVEL